MKQIMISINPKHVLNILKGKKTIEIRKTKPREYLDYLIDKELKCPIDVYIYCTKGKPYVARTSAGYTTTNDPDCVKTNEVLNGKVVAKFTLNKIDDYVNGRKWSWKSGAPMWGACNDYEAILKPSCLTEDELYDYREDLSFYAWHIDNLAVFDEPRELKSFLVYDHSVSGIGVLGQRKTFQILKPLTRAPQSWCYIEEGD